jgi:hypothetical protein
MIFYFAGNGRKPENVERIMNHPSENWGILLSYKDVRTKDGTGSARFKRVVKRKELSAEKSNK